MKPLMGIGRATTGWINLPFLIFLFKQHWAPHAERQILDKIWQCIFTDFRTEHNFQVGAGWPFSSCRQGSYLRSNQISCVIVQLALLIFMFLSTQDGCITSLQKCVFSSSFILFSSYPILPLSVPCGLCFCSVSRTVSLPQNSYPRGLLPIFFLNIPKFRDK